MQQHGTDGRTSATQTDEERRARREFLKQTGKIAIAAPAMALLLKADKASAAFKNQYGNMGGNSPGATADARRAARSVGIAEERPRRTRRRAASPMRWTGPETGCG